MPESTHNIPLDDLMKDPRVQNYLRKREREIKIHYRDTAKNYHLQIWLLSCMAPPLPLRSNSQVTIMITTT